MYVKSIHWLAILGLCIALAGCNAPASKVDDAAQSAPSVETVGAAVNSAAPSLAGKDASGESFDLADLRGKVVVLDFWGFW